VYYSYRDPKTQKLKRQPNIKVYKFIYSQLLFSCDELLLQLTG